MAIDVNTGGPTVPSPSQPVVDARGLPTIPYWTFFQGLRTVGPPLVLQLENGGNNDLRAKAATEVVIAGPTGAFTISGFVGGFNGRRLHLLNYSGQAMSVLNQTDSLVGNQIDTLTGADLVFAGNCSLVFVYYSVIPVSSVGVGGLWVVESSSP